MRRLTISLCAITTSLILQIASAQAAIEKVLYSFCSQQNCLDGELSYAGVALAGNELYTTTTSGGGTGTNNGTLVAVNRKTGAASVVYSFETHFGDAREAETALINLDGTLYGTTAGGGLGDGENGAGTIYSLPAKKKPVNEVNVLYSFCIKENCADGAFPSSSPLYLNGLFYGTTGVGGGGVEGCNGPYPGCGTLYSFDPVRSKEKVLHKFCSLQNCADGSRPGGNLVAANGLLYGTASSGGGGDNCDDMGMGCGNVFSIDPATRSENVLHAFAGLLDGGSPAGGLLYTDGLLYGTTQVGGSNSPCSTGYSCGTVFSVDPVSGAETILHAFKGGSADGEDPTGALIEVNGKLYGTTRIGGAQNDGTVFSIDLTTGKEKVVYSFCNLEQCSDGAAPYAGLTQVNGTLYGTTEGGGAIGGGTVFSLKP